VVGSVVLERLLARREQPALAPSPTAEQHQAPELAREQALKHHAITQVPV